MVALARARTLRAFTAALCLTAPGAAHAAEPAAEGPTLRWSAPPECPAETQLRAEVDRLVARPRSPSRAMAEVTAEVTRDADGPYRLRLVITDRDGGIRERRVDGATCAEVAAAAAVILALASDEDASPPSLSPPSLPPPSLPPPSPPPAEPRSTRGDRDRAPPSTAPEEARAPRPRVWDLAALGGVDFASLPAPAPGFGASVALGVGADRFELRAMAWLPQRATLAALTTAGGDVALYAAALRYCRSLVRGSIDLAPCAGFEAGALVASGVGLAAATSGVGPWLAPELAVAGAARLGPRFALALDLDGLVVLARSRFVITRGGEVFQPPPVTGRAIVGLRVRFE